MLAQRRRRWTNISKALGQRLVFAGATSACMKETAGSRTERDRNTKQTEVNQHISTSVYIGGDIIMAHGWPYKQTRKRFKGYLR